VLCDTKAKGNFKATLAHSSFGQARHLEVYPKQLSLMKRAASNIASASPERMILTLDASLVSSDDEIFLQSQSQSTSSSRVADNAGFPEERG